MLGINKKEVFGYGLYDFANSAFILIFNAYAFPIFYKETVWSGYENGDFIWGISLSVSVIIAMIISPIIGKYSDKTNRTNVLRLSILLSILGMLVLILLPSTFKYLFSISFILTNAFFVASLSIYDSILPHISTKEERSKVSGFSWGLGYVGGILCLIIVLIAQKFLPEMVKLPFIITTVFYGLFSLIAIQSFPKTNFSDQSLLNTKLKDFVFPKSKHILFILLAVWLLNEGIDTIIFFTSLFGRETLLMDTTTLGMLLVLVQLIAFPATWYSGVLAKKRGHLRIINYSIIIWIIIVVATQFVTNIYHFAIISILTGLVIGTTQSLLRSYFSLLIPKEKSSFMFGFYTIFSRFATLIGPALFGLLAGLYNQKIAMLSILLPLLLGWYFLNKKPKKEVFN